MVCACWDAIYFRSRPLIDMPIDVIFSGFALSIGLLLAIGPQNTYVIRKGLMHQHVFLVATICAGADCILIFMGAMGVASIFAQALWLHRMLVFMGFIFLCYLGMRAWSDSWSGNGTAAAIAGHIKPEARKTVILTALGFSILNPGALLDTFILIGGVASHYLDFMERLYFTIGAMAASVVWFYTLGFLATKMSPIFENPKASAILDFLVGCIMFSIAGMLFVQEIFPLLIS